MISALDVTPELPGKRVTMIAASQSTWTFIEEQEAKLLGGEVDCGSFLAEDFETLHVDAR